MYTVIQDMRYGARMIRKNPGSAAIAVIAMALGIGAATTIFSSADATMLRPFSFPNQERLVVLFEQKPAIGITRATISPGNIIEWRTQTKTLEEVIVMRNRDYTLTGEGPPERSASYGVSAAFFDALGVKPQLGRTFQRGEDEAGREQVAVLRHAFWQKRFGGDPQIVGKRILLDDRPFTIVGVMGKDFDFPYGGGEMWTPFVIEPAMKQEHRQHYLRALGLLKPGVSVAQVDADLNQVSRRIEQQFPDGEAGHSADAVALNDEYTRVAKNYVPVLIGAVLFVLLIASSNVANLLLARGAARQKEMAVRLALGATRGRLIRQLLTESLMLALLGGALGAALAGWGVDALSAGIPEAMSKYIPGWGRLGVNSYVLGFTLLISILTGILFGLFPALQATKTNLNETLKEGGGKGTPAGGGRSFLRNALVVTEIALSLVLLIGAGLFIRSFIQILRADLGVKPGNVLTMSLTLPRDRYPQEQQRRNFFEELLQRVKALPGVVSAGATHSLPMGGSNDGNSFQIIGRPPFEQGREPRTEFRIAAPEYFAAIGTDLRRGRAFTAQDNAAAPLVTLVNEAFAARFLSGVDPIGQRIILGNNADTPMEVIGVTANVMNEDLDDLREPCLYLAFAQFPPSTMNLVIRSHGSTEQLTPAVRREVAALDPRLPLAAVKTMEQVVYERRSPKEMMMWMLVIFGSMALVMATVGTYAVMAFSVAQRTHEFGVRIALGARNADILKLVMRRGLSLALLGIGIGLAGAVFLTRALAQLLYGVTATDPLTFLGVSAILSLAALLACYIPARRATKVDPMRALREE